MSILTIRPNGDSDCDLDRSTGSYNYANVDETTLSETDYNYLSWTDGADWYAFENPSQAGTINSVKVCCYANEVFGDVAEIRIGVVVGSTKYKKSSVKIAGSTTLYTGTWTTNPSTGSAWSWSDINSLIAGCEIETAISVRLYQCYVEVDYTATNPTVTTEAATSVTTAGCTGNGTITGLGDSDITRRGFCYTAGTSGDPTTSSSVVYDDGTFTSLESWTKAITGLTSNTGYRVRAYIVNTEGTFYGTTVQVTTLVADPTVTTQAVSDVSSTGFTGNGNITALGDYSITRRGFCVKAGTVGDPLTVDTVAYDDSNAYSTGAYTKAITGLTSGTAYRVRSYVVTSNGTVYGTTVDATTSSTAPTLTTEDCTIVVQTSCTANGTIVATGGANATRRGFCYKAGTTGDPTTADSTAYDDGDFSTGAYTKGITGLTAGTGYRVRAYATNSVDTAYGTTVQLTTAAANIPTVTTQAASDITTSSFVGNGTVSDIGTSDVTVRGFCYKKSSLGTPTTSDSTAYDTGTYSAEAYTKTVTGLSAGVNYNVRAYATNSTGTAYGDIVLVAITSNEVSSDAEPTLSTPLDSNTPEATHVAWINSRFIANETDTNKFDFTDTSPYTSLIENNYWGSTDNPVTCDYKGDKLTALFTAWQEIYAWGTQGLQVFQDDGSTPFVNVPGAAGEAGLEAVYSVSKMDNTVFALCVVDKKRVVVKLQGRAPVVISEPIANILAGMETVSDAIGDIICVGGIAIYLLNFPTADQTWAYDYKNDIWLRWSYYNADKGKHERFIGQHSCFVKRWNKHLIMSRKDGKIYEMSRSVYDDADNDMVSYRRTGWLDWGDTSKIKHSKDLFIKTKTFANNGVDSPTMLLRWRDDGYPIWSDFVELDLDPKYFGDFIIHLSRMGSYRSRQYEFRLSDEVDMALVNVQENFG